MATDIKISELIEITSNKTINQLIVNDRANSSDAGITKRISISNLLPTYDSGDSNKRAIVGNDQLISTAQSPGSESVNTNVIRNSAITESKIASQSVTGSKIANSTITNTNIANNTILGSNISTTTDVTVNSINATTLQGSTVQGGALNVTGNTTFNTRQYTWPNSYTGDRYLRVDSSGNLSWSQPVQSGTTLVFDDVLPVGAILPWVSNSAPNNYFICDGSTFNGTQYPELSTILNTTYGPKVGNLFKLPDLRGKVTVGSGTNISDLSGNLATFTLGTSGGEYAHKLTIAEMPSHSHDILCKVSVDSGGSEIPPTDSKSSNIYYPTLSTGGDQSHNNIQPYLVTNYIIKAKPDPKVNFGLTIGAGLSANTATGNIDLSGGTIKAKVDDQTITFNGTNQLSVKTGGISGQQLTGQQTGLAPIFGARAWVNFNCNADTSGNYNIGTGDKKINGQGNIVNAKRNSTGYYTLSFIAPMPNANYCVVGSAKNGIDGVTSTDLYTVAATFRATNYVGIQIVQGTTFANPSAVNVVIIG
jgi:microcystin-dependent protein